MIAAYPDFTYGDGNGNLYSVTQEEISYSPISKEMSSSGFYSGGEAKRITLTAPQKEKINKAFQKMQNASPSELEKNRLKGTGVLKFKAQKQQKTLIFKSSSQLREDFEKLLRSFLIE
ncbi:MAG: hypothetical protein N3A69_14125 [Leptospiraceae bacterium]|nr:hypothetical protein [Leptospiraceae bacterium]